MKPNPLQPRMETVLLSSPFGLRMEINANGSIRRIQHGEILLNLFFGNEFDGGLANLFLRRLGESPEAVPLLGPRSVASYALDEGGLMACGQVHSVVFRLRLSLAESKPAWFWHVEIENVGATEEVFDLILTHDLALAHEGAVRLNEYYVSQYVDHCPLEHPENGVVVATRQNLSMGGKFPWTMIGSLRRGVSYATDAIQVYGLDARAGEFEGFLSGGLAGKRRQHEHSMAAVQDEAFVLKPGEVVRRGFFGWFEPAKPKATTAADLSFVDQVMGLPEANPPPWPENARKWEPVASLFTACPLLEAKELDEAGIRAFFGADRRHVERENGQLLSFFTGECSHVVLKAKELAVLRPHGQLLRSGGVWVPDEAALTSTAWMAGVFHSMITQGHVSINRFLSSCHGYLGWFRSQGQRVFVEIDGSWRLLGVPSAFEMVPDSCRWIYQHAGGVIEVVASASDDRHELRLSLTVLAGGPVRFLISNHIAINGNDGGNAVPVRWERSGQGILVRAVADSDVGRRFPDGGFLISPGYGTALETVGGDELLFVDGVSRNQPFLCLRTAKSLSASVMIEGRLVESTMAFSEDFWANIRSGLRIKPPSASVQASAVNRLDEIFPWYVQNALVHYLSPRGLEQYSGGGWGTRDVCQGAVELLLGMGRFEPIREILQRVFRQQNPDGDWPQWFMFFDRERNIRPGDSHGDVVYWPVLALSQYLCASGDMGFLEERVAFFHADGEMAAEKASVWQHVERALEVMRQRVIPGTHLAAYGHGDWNDALQPAKPEMRDRLCSSWTVTLSYQVCTALAEVFQRSGDGKRAARFRDLAASILGDFQNLLIPGEVVAGLVYFHDDGSIDPLLHPHDEATGISYSLLPMIHAIINDMFSPAQAEAHLTLIRNHLLGPDGARLFDRPLAYRGGMQTYFQRAETASFFGREIGLMYTHAHLRYCEALARFGDAEGFFYHLCLANPIAIRDLVPSAALRQANCYYSSSDADFLDRYEAFNQYDRIARGEVTLEGGWRVYSSGAGIGTRLVIQCFLGVRLEADAVVVDPVIPAELDGLVATVKIDGRPMEITYRIEKRGCGVVSVSLNGVALKLSRENNRYRAGAVRIEMATLEEELVEEGNRMTVWID